MLVENTRDLPISIPDK
uniref:Uncharacterized protein n=1 Tax=Salix viminalis TaxID=40686 RepID=A0A6N2N102_SALVM